MKEGFNELYTRLYNENFSKLEELRKKNSKQTVNFLLIMFASFFLSIISPIFIILFIICVFFKIIKAIKNQNAEPTENLNYEQLFKEKIVQPLLKNEFEDVKYDPHMGVSSSEYKNGGYNENFDRYASDDLVTAPLKIDENNDTTIVFSEVHTQRRSEDSDGHTTYVTIFHGIFARFSIQKSIDKSIYIRSNGRVSKWNKDRVNMDMSEFEKVFDVECNDKILAMRLLTSDVMAEMVDLYRKYKYRFEINIINNTVYMRLSSGTMFEPNVFGKALKYKELEKYYLVLKAITSIASHIYQTIDNLEI